MGHKDHSIFNLNQNSLKRSVCQELTRLARVGGHVTRDILGGELSAKVAEQS